MRNTKKKLLISLFALLMSVAMLAGSSYAWFTDSASNTGNRIKAGTLDVDLVMFNEATNKYESIDDENGTIADKVGSIFGHEDSSVAQDVSADTLWEPGKTQIVFLGVQNKGSLALQYKIILNVEGELASALEYAIIDGAKPADLSSVSSWDSIINIANVQTGDVELGEKVIAQNGVLDEIVKGTKDETDYFALAIHMKEDADNSYKAEYIDIDISVIAKQVSAESDAFDNQYDKDAKNTFSIEYELGSFCEVLNDQPTTIIEGDEKEIIFNATVGHTFDTMGNPYIGFSATGCELIVEPSTDDLHQCKVTISNPYSNVVITAKEISFTCLAAGTQITMGDGSIKNIEDIKEGEEVLTFNHEKGVYEAQKVALAYAGETAAKPFTLHFTNGIELSMVGEHDLFEKESNKYVVISDFDAESFIGKHFYNASEGRYEELLSVTYGEEPVMYYSLYPFYNFNCIANGMLSVADDNDEYLNIYEFNEGLVADADALRRDIETYGLYEYVGQYGLSQEYFDAFQCQYLNISVGKGLVSWEELLQRYAEYPEK